MCLTARDETNIIYMLWCLLYNLTLSCTGRTERDNFKMKGWKNIWEIWELIYDGFWVVCVCVLDSRWGNRNIIWMLWCLDWSYLFTIPHIVMHRKERKRLWKIKVRMREKKIWKWGLSLSAAGLMFFWKNELCTFKGTVLLLRNAISYKRHTHTHSVHILSERLVHISRTLQSKESHL